MKKIIKNNQPFQCLKNTFSAQLPAGTYQLSYSIDGVTYYQYVNAEGSADINGDDLLIVNGFTPSTYFKISGIADTITVLV